MAEFASNGKGNLGVALGAVGTGLSLLGAHGFGNGALGNYNGYNGVGCDRGVNRYELDLIREIQNKDTTIAIKESENYTDKKLVEVYTALNRQDKEINTKIDLINEKQNAINNAQAVYNAHNNSTLGYLQRAIEEITALHIPASKVCPTPMPRYNTWDIPIAENSGTTTPAA